MLGENPARGFDYMFEPIEGEETDENTEDTDGRRPVPSHGAHRRQPARPSRALLAVVGLAAATLVVGIVMLLMRPEPAEQVDAPIDSGPSPTSASPIATTEPVPAPRPVTAPVVEGPAAESPVVETPVVESAVPAATNAPQPPPSPEQTTAAPVPDAPAANPPATRAPMSVEPEPRAPFPNQQPDYGSDERGGLLGGGGLL